MYSGFDVHSYWKCLLALAGAKPTSRRRRSTRASRSISSSKTSRYVTSKQVDQLIKEIEVRAWLRVCYRTLSWLRVRYRGYVCTLSKNPPVVPLFALYLYVVHVYAHVYSSTKCTRLVYFKEHLAFGCLHVSRFISRPTCVRNWIRLLSEK